MSLVICCHIAEVFGGSVVSFMCVNLWCFGVCARVRVLPSGECVYSCWACVKSQAAHAERSVTPRGDVKTRPSSTSNNDWWYLWWFAPVRRFTGQRWHQSAEKLRQERRWRLSWSDHVQPTAWCRPRSIFNVNRSVCHSLTLYCDQWSNYYIYERAI